MSAPHAVKNRRVPENVQPLKPFKRPVLQTFRHVHSRKAARRTTVFPGAARLFPSFAHMLQPEEDLCDPVRIHPVIWTCTEAATQERQA